MRFLTEMLTDVGGRKVNEDRCNFLEANGTTCWVVTDGLGGQGGGDVASQLATDAVLSRFHQDAGVSAEVLRAGLLEADKAVASHQDRAPRLAGMRTTAVVLLADSRQAQWAHIGDTRLYHFRRGQVVFQTEDHSVTQALAKAGEISRREIRFHEDRSRLLRSLGGQEEPRLSILDVPVALQPEDAFLMATDGLWEHVTETEMEAELAKSDDPAGWLRRMQIRLRQRAVGGYDNYTAIGVLVQE